MVKPSVAELTNNGEFNRYILAIATAKCARDITNEYVKQKEIADKSKEFDKTIVGLVNKEYRDEKAVKVAVNKLYKKDYVIKGYTDKDLEEVPEAVEE